MNTNVIVFECSFLITWKPKHFELSNNQVPNKASFWNSASETMKIELNLLNLSLVIQNIPL